MQSMQARRRDDVRDDGGAVSQTGNNSQSIAVSIVERQLTHKVLCTHVGLEEFGLAVEWVYDLPSGQDGDVDGEQDADDHEELVVLDGLLVEFDVGEDRMDAPRLGEHGAECQREAGHQRPDAGRADDGQGRLARQVRVQSQEDDARVSQQAADDDHVVQVRTRHFDVPATHCVIIRSVSFYRSQRISSLSLSYSICYCRTTSASPFTHLLLLTPFGASRK